MEGNSQSGSFYSAVLLCKTQQAADSLYKAPVGVRKVPFRTPVVEKPSDLVERSLVGCRWSIIFFP